MIIKLGTRGLPGMADVTAWQYLDGVENVACVGYMTVADTNARFTVDNVQVLPVVFVGPSDDPDTLGYVHFVDRTDKETLAVWLNCREAYLLNDTGGTVDRLDTGGGLTPADYLAPIEQAAGITPDAGSTRAMTRDLIPQTTNGASSTTSTRIGFIQA